MVTIAARERAAGLEAPKRKRPRSALPFWTVALIVALAAACVRSGPPGRRTANASQPIAVRVLRRFEEEWLAHLEEVDGKLAKLMHAFGVWLRAPRVAEAAERRAVVERPKMRLDLDRTNAGTALLCLGLAVEAGLKVWHGAPALDCAFNMAPLVPGFWALIHGLRLRRTKGRFVEI
jgi:hypothetical protein